MDKNDLRAYGTRQDKIQDLQDQRRELDAMMTATQAKLPDGMPHSPAVAGNARFTGLLEKRMQIDEQIEKLEQQNKDLEADLMINCDYQDYRILRTIYIDGYGLELAAEKLGITARHLSRLRDKAIEHLSLVT